MILPLVMQAMPPLFATCVQFHKISSPMWYVKLPCAQQLGRFFLVVTHRCFPHQFGRPPTCVLPSATQFMSWCTCIHPALVRGAFTCHRHGRMCGPAKRCTKMCIKPTSVLTPRALTAAHVLLPPTTAHNCQSHEVLDFLSYRVGDVDVATLIQVSGSKQFPLYSMPMVAGTGRCVFLSGSASPYRPCTFLCASIVVYVRTCVSAYVCTCVRVYVCVCVLYILGSPAGPCVFSSYRMPPRF